MWEFICIFRLYILPGLVKIKISEENKSYSHVSQLQVQTYEHTKQNNSTVLNLSNDNEHCSFPVVPKIHSKLLKFDKDRTIHYSVITATECGVAHIPF